MTATRPSPVGIMSAGMYVPDRHWTSADLAEKTGIPEEIIRTKFGLHRIPVPGPDDHTNQMGIWAAQDAIEKAGIDPLEAVAVVLGEKDGSVVPRDEAALVLEHHRQEVAVEAVLEQNTIPARAAVFALQHDTVCAHDPEPTRSVDRRNVVECDAHRPVESLPALPRVRGVKDDAAFADAPALVRVDEVHIQA